MLCHPLDLWIQSGFLSEAGFRPALIDAVFEGLSPDQTLGRIAALRPLAALCLVGTYTLKNDIAFLGRLKSTFPDIRLFLSGDAARFSAEIDFHPPAEAEGMLMDFATPGLRDHLAGRASPFLSTERSAVQPPEAETRLSYPFPPASLARRCAYRLPFFSDPRFYSIATSFGCPFGCRYCNTHLLGHRDRPVDEVMGELDHAAALGFQSLYIRDATFMANRKRALRLFRQWHGQAPRFHWICFARADRLDEELVDWAAKCGCRMMMVGVESFDDAWLKEMDRHVVEADLSKTFRALRKRGIRSAAQIMLGMGGRIGDAALYERRLMGLLGRLQPDFTSLNIFSHRPGVPCDAPSLAHVLSRRDAYTRMAARINRRFYLNPRRMIRLARWIESPRQLALVLHTAREMIRTGPTAADPPKNIPAAIHCQTKC